MMLRIADLIEANHDALARAESIDNGKPLTLAHAVDIPRAASSIRFFGTSITHGHSEAHFADDKAINYTLRQPVGVAGCISPWNLPLYLLTWKIAPALASGCTVVAKPSEITPMTAYPFSKLRIEAGLPPGVLNLVQCLGPTGLGPRAAAAAVPRRVERDRPAGRGQGAQERGGSALGRQRGIQRPARGRVRGWRHSASSGTDQARRSRREPPRAAGAPFPGRP